MTRKEKQLLAIYNGSTTGKLKKKRLNRAKKYLAESGFRKEGDRSTLTDQELRRMKVRI